MTALVHAVRRLGASPAFTIPAIGGLALAIGAATAVFSVYSAMLLRPMGFDDARRIAALWQTDEAHGQKQVEVCYADLEDWRRADDAFSAVALASSVNLDFPLFAGERPEHVAGTTVSGNFFRVLGAAPFAGRLFSDDDDRPGVPQRIVVSHRLWKTRFGGDYAVLGRQVRIGPDSATVIGITRPEFDFPGDVDIWIPLRAAWPDVEKNPRLRVFRSVARLRPGVSTAQAQARMRVVARQVEASLPAGSARYGVLVTPILDEIYGAARPAIRVLLGAVTVVLLIACANAANLLLARFAERRRELAVRAALGAPRARLVNLLLAESAILAIVSGTLGMLLAAGAVTMLVRLAPEEIPRIAQASVDLPALAFGIAITAATLLLFGLAPSWMASHRDPLEALQQAGPRAGPGRGRTRFRRLLIAGQVGLTVLLLVGATLLTRSFTKLAAVDPGFRAERVLTFRITLDRPGQEARRAFYTEVLDRIRALPGVESAGAVLLRPLSGAVGWDTVYAVEGQTPEQQRANPNGNYEAISPDYFRTMGIRVIEQLNDILPINNVLLK